MRRTLRDTALVIERRVLGESDRVVVLLARRSGKLSAVAPAGRRSRKRFGGCLELFARIEVDLVDRGRGGLWRLAEASLQTSHPGIRRDLVAIAHAGYLSELTAALLREGEEAAAVFDLLAGALGRLEQGPLAALDLRRFELALLALSGLAPRLDACALCGAERAERWRFDHEAGGLVCAACVPGPHAEPLPATAAALLRALQADRPPTGSEAADRRAVRALLARVIDQHVGRPLKARRFLEQLAREAGCARTE